MAAQKNCGAKAQIKIGRMGPQFQSPMDIQLVFIDTVRPA